MLLIDALDEIRQVSLTSFMCFKFCQFDQLHEILTHIKTAIVQPSGIRTVLMSTRPGALLDTNPSPDHSVRDDVTGFTGYELKPLSEAAATGYLSALSAQLSRRIKQLGPQPALELTDFEPICVRVLQLTPQPTPLLLLLSFAAGVEPLLPSIQRTAGSPSSPPELFSDPLLGGQLDITSPLLTEHQLLRRIAQRAIYRKVRELRLPVQSDLVSSAPVSSFPAMFEEVFCLLACYAYSLRMGKPSSSAAHKSWFAAANLKDFEMDAEHYFGPSLRQTMARRLITLKRLIKWPESEQTRYAMADTPSTPTSSLLDSVSFYCGLTFQLLLAFQEI